MKKLITIILLVGLTSMSLYAQTYKPNSTNTSFTGYNKLHATKTKVGTASLTQTKISTWDATATEVNDTINLSVAINSLPFILMPHLTTTEINALTNNVEGTFVYDSSLHVFKFWNGSVWKTITTN